MGTKDTFSSRYSYGTGDTYPSLTLVLGVLQFSPSYLAPVRHQKEKETFLKTAQNKKLMCQVTKHPSPSQGVSI